MKITFEQKCELSSQFYFNIVHSLGIEDECIRQIDNGTENTEKWFILMPCFFTNRRYKEEEDDE